jgi:hypothetical protein
VSQKSLNVFARLYLRNPWDNRNGIGAKRCVLFLSFVWKFKNIDDVKVLMSYVRYKKKSVSAFFASLKLLDGSCVRSHFGIPYDYRNGMVAYQTSHPAVYAFFEKNN